MFEIQGEKYALYRREGFEGRKEQGNMVEIYSLLFSLNNSLTNRSIEFFFFLLANYISTRGLSNRFTRRLILRVRQRSPSS